MPSAWIIGLMAGVVGGFGTLIGGTVGLAATLLLVASLLVRSAGRPRHQAASLAGAASGFGATWLALLARAQAACAPESCTAPDMTPWFAIGGAIFVLGAAGTVLVVIRRSGRSGP